MERPLLAAALWLMATFLQQQPAIAKTNWTELLLEDSKTEELERLEKDGEKFMTTEFRLLWARCAYAAGNHEGAIREWSALANEGNKEADYILKVLFTKSCQ